MLFTRITNLPVLFVLTPTVGTEYIRYPQAVGCSGKRAERERRIREKSPHVTRQARC